MRIAANTVALATPLALLGGAYVSQYGFGLYPCEMCWWQRYPHFLAVAFALIGLVRPGQKVWTALAALAILTSGLIGAFHAGVEYNWWEGITGCATVAQPGGDPLQAILDAPIIRCDVAPWTLLGISLAGYNFLVSTAAALAIFVLLRREGGVK